MDGRIISSAKMDVRLRYGQSVKRQTLDLAEEIQKHGRDNLYLRIALEVHGRRVSEETVFLTPPRFLALPKGKVSANVRQLTSTQALITFRSEVFQHRFAFDLPGLEHQSSDNYFELYPREQKDVIVELLEPVTKSALAKRLHFQSLADTYA